MPACIFCQMVTGTIPIKPIYETSTLLAFHDINPQAPIHALIIPKKHIPTINATEITDQLLLGEMILAGQSIAGALHCQEAGYRLVFNVNADGGQQVYHIHLHLLGGRPMAWPPG